MPIDWELENNKLLIFTVSGRLSVEEYQAIHATSKGIAQKTGKLNALIRLDGFEGWSADKHWGDISATEAIDPYLHKLAIVGDEQWRSLAEVFTLKGLRPVPIEYFVTGQEATARRWLGSV